MKLSFGYAKVENNDEWKIMNAGEVVKVISLYSEGRGFDSRCGQFF